MKKITTILAATAVMATGALPALAHDEENHADVKSETAINATVSQDATVTLEEVSEGVRVVVTANSDITDVVVTVTIDGVIHKEKIAKLAKGEQFTKIIKIDKAAPKVLPNTTAVKKTVTTTSTIKGKVVKADVSYTVNSTIVLDNSKSETKTEVKPETKPETKPEVKPETKPEVKPETNPEVKPETNPETKPEAQPKVNPGSQPETNPETKPETNPEVKPEVKPETNPEAQPETNPGTQPETNPGTQPVAQPETNPGSQPETNPETKPDAQPEARPSIYNKIDSFKKLSADEQIRLAEQSVYRIDSSIERMKADNVLVSLTPNDPFAAERPKVVAYIMQNFDMDKLNEYFVEYLNADRKRLNRTEVYYEKGLQKYTQIRAEETKNSSTWHVRPDGTDYDTVVNGTPYAKRLINEKAVTAATTTAEELSSEKYMAKRLYEDWYVLEGDNDNMLGENIQSIAIGLDILNTTAGGNANMLLLQKDYVYNVDPETLAVTVERVIKPVLKLKQIINF